MDLEFFTQIGESLSLLLILLVMGLFVIAMARTKTLRSFQFEMFVFAIVLFAAEVPRVLGTLGLVDVNSYEDFGLEVHSVSMVVLVAFVAIRVYGFQRPTQRLLAPTNVDQKIAAAVRTILETQMGASAAKAVAFYFDPNIAVFDPKGYAKMLEKTFKGGAAPLVKLMVVELCQQFSLEYKDGMDLEACVKMLRRKGDLSPSSDLGTG